MSVFRRSLLRRMVLGQLLVVVAFSMLSVANLVWHFHQHGQGEFDQEVLIFAKSIAASLKTPAGDASGLNTNAAVVEKFMREFVGLLHPGGLNGADPYDFVMRVSDENGLQIFRSPEHPSLALDSRPAQFYDIVQDGKLWRALNHRVEGENMVIQLAKTTSPESEALCDIVQQFIFWPLLWFLPVAALVTWFTSFKGLAPLNELADMISHRSPKDMRPLQQTAPYAETEPLVNEINSLLHKLNTTLQRERNFLADAAHELRTPLAVIQAQVHVLRHAQSEADKAGASDELQSGIERAAALIQKLLLTAKVSVEDFAPRFELLDLSALVRERIAAFSVLALDKKIDIELQALTAFPVKVDRETFISAIDNVLDNAIRYTPEAGQVRVRIEPGARQTVQMTVADSGPGIPPALHTRVFERFFRVAGTEQQGSGLGLAIVGSVMNLHAGQVTLASGLQQRGLSVKITLPSASSPRGAAGFGDTLAAPRQPERATIRGPSAVGGIGPIGRALEGKGA